MYENKLYDCNYTKQVKKGGFPNHISRVKKKVKKDTDKLSFLDKIMNTLFPALKDKWKNVRKGKIKKATTDTSGISMEERVKELINLPDDEFNTKLLDSDLRRYLTGVNDQIQKANIWIKEKISPSVFDIRAHEVNVSGMYSKTYYANSYPSSIDFLWTRDLLNMYTKWDATWFIYPSQKHEIESTLKRRATQLKAEIHDAHDKGRTLDTDLEVEYQDVENIRKKLSTWEEKYYQNSFYVTLYNNQTGKEKEANNEENLNIWSKKFEQKMQWLWVNVKPAALRQDEWFDSTSPLCIDDLAIYRSMLSTSLWGAFPFISNDLIQDEWILYGINLHTGSLVIFDRFSKSLPNSNSVIFATSGAGKSFTVKLEILRYLLLWIDVIVIDPENEYKPLIDKVWGTYVNVSVNSHQYINPFDLPPKLEDFEYREGDLLRWKIMDLLGLIWVLLWWLTPEEEAILDSAIQQTYQLKEIDFESPAEGKIPPLMEDLLNVLEGTDGGNNLAIRLSKYVTGSFGNIFNNYTNIDLEKWLTVFSIRDMEEALRTPAMYNILNFIWTKIRSEKKRRMLVVDEAWIMMQHEMAANFMYWLIKRARKYKLGVTTISQDVEDFMNSPYGKPIVSNSAMQILLKQSAASIKALDKVFNLSDTEKTRLVSGGIWEGLFFAGNQHVAMKVLASPYEKDFIET